MDTLLPMLVTIPTFFAVVLGGLFLESRMQAVRVRASRRR